jgi:hypothetical protein
MPLGWSGYLSALSGTPMGETVWEQGVSTTSPNPGLTYGGTIFPPALPVIYGRFDFSAPASVLHACIHQDGYRQCPSLAMIIVLGTADANSRGKFFSESNECMHFRKNRKVHAINASVAGRAGLPGKISGK